MRKLTLERNPMSAMSVGVPSERKLTCVIIRGFTLEKNPMLVRNAGKTSVEARLSLNTRESMLEINPRNPEIKECIESFS